MACPGSPTRSPSRLVPISQAKIARLPPLRGIRPGMGLGEMFPTTCNGTVTGVIWIKLDTDDVGVSAGRNRSRRFQDPAPSMIWTETLVYGTAIVTPLETADLIQTRTTPRTEGSLFVGSLSWAA